MSQILAQWESLMTSRNNSDLSSALKYLVETRIDSPIMILQLPRYRIIHDKSRAIAK